MWRCLLVLLVVAAAGARACSPHAVEVGVCAHDAACRLLYHSGGLGDALSYYGLLVASGNATAVPFFTGPLAVAAVDYLPADTCALALGGDGAAGRRLTEALVRFRGLVQADATPCADPNEQVVFDAASGVATCACALGKVCGAAVAAASTTSTPYTLATVLSIVLPVLVLALFIVALVHVRNATKALQRLHDPSGDHLIELAER